MVFSSTCNINITHVRHLHTLSVCRTTKYAFDSKISAFLFVVMNWPRALATPWATALAYITCLHTLVTLTAQKMSVQCPAGVRDMPPKKSREIFSRSVELCCGTKNVYILRARVGYSGKYSLNGKTQLGHK